MDQNKTQTVRINKEDHCILAFYCKFKGISIKDYILDRVKEDEDLQRFKKRIDELKFI